VPALGFEKALACGALFVVLPTPWRAPPGAERCSSVGGGLGAAWDDLAAPLGDLWGVTAEAPRQRRNRRPPPDPADPSFVPPGLTGLASSSPGPHPHAPHPHHSSHSHHSSHRHSARVVSVRLDGWGLRGRLPPHALGNLLGALAVLDLPHNRLAGEVTATKSPSTNLRAGRRATLPAAELQ
jgi:hypothetical protein